MATGTFTTYDLTVGTIVDIEPTIHDLDPFDTPLLGMYGSDGRSALATGKATQKKVEWLDENLLTPRAPTSANFLIGATTIELAAADAFKFQVGDVLAHQGERIRVTGVDAAGDTLTVTRGFASTTAVAGTAADILVGVGVILAEGSDPGDGVTVDRTNRFNYTQIFGPYKIATSATENVISKYGLGSGHEFEHQVSRRTKEVAIAMEQAILYGVRSEDTGSKLRSMGGLINYITANVDSTTTTLTSALLLDQLQAVYDDGGSPDRIVAGGKQKRLISGFDSSAIQLTRADNGRGQVVDTFMSDFSLVTLLLNRWTRVSDLFIFNRDQATLLTLRPLQFQMLGKTGDSIKGQIVGEKSLRFTEDAHAARFSALT